MPSTRGIGKQQPAPAPALVPQDYPGLADGRGMVEEQWNACREMLEAVYEAREQDRDIAEIFQDLPDREDFPDYYVAIPEPECLNHISAELAAQAYSRPEDFFKQLHLVFLNAKHYWAARGQAGVFPHTDPYYNLPAKPRRGRPPGRRSLAGIRRQPSPVYGPSQLSVSQQAAATDSSLFIHLAPLPSGALSSSTQRNMAIPVLTQPTPNPARMAQHEADLAIVAALDATLPRWEGPKDVLPGNSSPGGVSGSGWLGEGQPEYATQIGQTNQPADTIRTIIKAVGGYRDFRNNRLAEVLDVLPDTADIPYLSFNRLYNALTSPIPLSLPSSGIPAPSTTFFASIPAGPGNARSLHEANQEIKAGAVEEQVGHGITTFRANLSGLVSSCLERQSLCKGDYVHLINPDDATKPIVGQIFKTFVPTKGNRTHYVSVCWYYRPEQTVHASDQMFYEREVFKTGQFCDHQVEDVLEKISVQFFVNCIPEELRQTDFMSVIPFERIIEPRTVPSPLTQGVQGPGFFGEPKKILGGSAQDEDDDDDDDKLRKRPTRMMTQPPTPAAHTPTTYSGLALSTTLPHSIPKTLTPNYQMATKQRPIQAPRSVPTQTGRTFNAVMSSQQALDQVIAKEMLPDVTSRLFPRDARGQVLWFSGPPLAPGSVSVPQPLFHSLEYLDCQCKRKMGEEWTHRKKKSTQRDTFLPDEADDQDDATWWAEGQSKEELLESLKAVIDGV
ncbi:uncharacterized protein L203_104290 [Cryptococcus depauperatus CBS 7841]|uniref:Uncharacterized protein n=1 Tax=Cryptococcus depauperatus CBS 7841 TaxID=1295531 RepID=A0AAJ8JVG9_9TREE